jgi:ATP-dependent Clp protease protease subunit
MKPNKFFNASKKDSTLTLNMYDIIGESMWGDDGATPAMVAAALKDDFANIELHLNSPGGDAFAGVAIYNLLKACSKPVNVIVDGLAASAASIVAMDGDTITMRTGSVMMIHEALSMAFGNATDMRKTADTLDTVTSGIADLYVARQDNDKQTVLDMQNAETWMNAQEAVDKGFATSLSKDNAVKNSFDLKMFKNTPEKLKAEVKAATDCQCSCKPCFDGDCSECDHNPCTCLDCDCPQHSEPAEPDTASNLTSLFTHQLELNKRK